MDDSGESLRDRLKSARYSDDVDDALAALEQMHAGRLYDLILDALTDERVQLRARAAELSTAMLDAGELDLSQLPAESAFSAYFGALELEEIRAAAKPRRQNVAGMLAILLPRVEVELRALSEEQFEEARRQSTPLTKISLTLPGAFLFQARLLAWKLDQSPSAVLHAIWALGKRLPD